MIDREHRSVERDHPRALDNRIEEKGQIGKSDERLRCERDRLEIQQWQNAAGTISASRDENRTDIGVREECLQFLGALAVRAGENVIAIEDMAGDSRAKAYRANHFEAALQRLLFDR